MISNESLKKFKRLYKAKFNIDLTQEEATEMATDLVNLIKILLEPTPKPTVEPFQNEGRQNETI